MPLARLGSQVRPKPPKAKKRPKDRKHQGHGRKTQPSRDRKHQGHRRFIQPLHSPLKLPVWVAWGPPQAPRSAAAHPRIPDSRRHPARQTHLPDLVRAEGPKEHAEYLLTLVVTTPLPERKGFGRNRHRPPEETRLSAVKRRRRAAGQAKKGMGGVPSACGPREDAAGHGCGSPEGDAPVDAWADALARVRRQLARARGWQAWLDGAPDRTRADLARREALSRARITQVLKLLELDPSILADLDRPDRSGPVPGERVLRRTAALPSLAAQRRQYAAACGISGPAPRGPARRHGPAAPPVPRGESFTHALDRARRYQAWLDDGTHASLASIGRAEGISGPRVGQLLSLLHLAPEIVAVLEQPREALPKGLTRKAVREIARVRAENAHLAAFSARWPGMLGGVKPAAAK